MIACFLSNISAKYYKNPSMLSRVIAKNVGDVFLRHSVVLLAYVLSTEYGSTLRYGFLRYVALREGGKQASFSIRHTVAETTLIFTALHGMQTQR